MWKTLEGKKIKIILKVKNNQFNNNQVLNHLMVLVVKEKICVDFDEG